MMKLKINEAKDQAMKEFGFGPDDPVTNKRLMELLHQMPSINLRASEIFEQNLIKK